MFKLARYNIFDLSSGKLVATVTIEIMGRGDKKSNCREAIKQLDSDPTMLLAEFIGYVR